MKGTRFKRCGCRRPDTGTPLGARCPKLRRTNGAWASGHGVWHYQAELVPTPKGRRRTLRRGGFTTHEAATQALDAIWEPFSIADSADTDTMNTIAAAVEAAHRAKQPLPTAEQMRRELHIGVSPDQIPTVGEYLDDWLSGRRALALGTWRTYESHIRLYFTPHFGHIRLDRLNRGHVASVFDAIEERNEMVRAARASHDPLERAAVHGMKIAGPATQNRIRATLRKALNDAVRAELITGNPATHLELPPGAPPKPVIWTPERVHRWETTGEPPCSVMVWPPELTGQFLDHAATDELYALFHLIAMRGLRRGEACGLPWTNVDLTAATLTVDTQLIQIGWDTTHSSPKSDASNRIIPLDTGTVDALRAHWHYQQADKGRTGTNWHDTGLVFTHHDGTPWHPADVTDRFQRLRRAAELPPIRLHDLRHGAATTTLAAGADMRTVQELLGHASYTLTANTYTSILPESARTAAEHAAKLISRSQRED